MPTPECWEELGALRAEVTMYEGRRREDMKSIAELQKRVDELEHDRLRVKTVGGVVAFILTGIGVFFSEPIKKFLLSLFSL